VDQVQAVLGGDSGVLTPNAAAASVNFITRKPNFDHAVGIAELSATTYDERRADLYYSAPIAHNLAFNVGGYISTTNGQRDAGFSYPSYQWKGELEQRFDDGAYIRLGAKFGVRHDPYYADMPYDFVNGKVTSIPGTDGLTTNIGGPAFGDIGIPNSCLVSPAQGCYRDYSLRKGIETGVHQARLDFYVPLAHDIALFGKMHYLTFDWDFNGLFPGSGVGDAGLTSAVDYLSGGANSPIASMLTAGAAAYPGATFGIRDVTTGQVISANDTAALNALNGNGLLQQTWLNAQDIRGKDFAGNWGARWHWEGGSFDNSLTLGAMYFYSSRYNDQSAVANVINGVSAQSHIYDVVALNPSGQVIGSLTDHGLVAYGDWGNGIWKDDFNSLSGYLNDELQIGRHWHIDLGARAEGINDHQYGGNSASAAAPVAVGYSNIVGFSVPQGSEWNGTYTENSRSFGKTAKSIGVNYTFDNNLALYGQYAFGFQMNPGGGGPANPPTSVEFEEVGARYANSFVFANGGLFQTSLNNQTTGCFDPNNPTFSCNAQYNVQSRGIEYQLSLRPLSFLKLTWFGVLQNPKLTNVQAYEDNSSGVTVIPLQSFPLYNGNVDDRTPKSLQTIEAAFQLPDNAGEVYVRGRYNGSFFADVANQVDIPGYWALDAGLVWNATENLTVNLSGRNLTN
ncbi:MAG: TonB-dependent receptor domain-containing protein, partial [Gemmataceae bacterium]